MITEEKKEEECRKKLASKEDGGHQKREDPMEDRGYKKVEGINLERRRINKWW